MPAALEFYSHPEKAAELRQLASEKSDAKERQILLALAAIVDGESRQKAASIAGIGTKALRKWINRFCLNDDIEYSKSLGRKSKLTYAQRVEFKKIVLAGPGLMFQPAPSDWTRVHLHIVLQGLGFMCSERTVSKILNQLELHGVLSRKHSRPAASKSKLSKVKAYIGDLPNPNGAKRRKGIQSESDAG